jgi:hypothetical protein
MNCSDENTTSHTPIYEYNLTESVLIYNQEKVYNNLILVCPNFSKSPYLVDKGGNIVKQWEFEIPLGNDFELLPNGKVLGIFKSTNPIFSFGGYGGIIRIYDQDNLLEWSYEVSNQTEIAHHDVEMLQNGNVMIMIWEKIDVNTLQDYGVDFDQPIYTEKLIEVNTQTNEIVWQWRSWDHIVQDHDATANAFGTISENPNKIDINYNMDRIGIDISGNGDFMHANGIDIDENNDLIYMSVNYYSEIWVIDHSTTTEEASVSLGGNYDKGGDLVYRFGNPEAYGDLDSERIFYNNHFPNLLENEVPGQQNLLVYSNFGENMLTQSNVYELELPNVLSLEPNNITNPEIVWYFTDENLFHGRISGADRLQNGNTIICEGDFGVWEVSPEKEVVWKYSNENFDTYWRSYGYSFGDSALDYIVF